MCYSPVCHAATVATGLKPVATVAAFDLHALDTPPAFILSQDQTLKKMKVLNLLNFVQKNKINPVRKPEFKLSIYNYIYSYLKN